jgi:hypothetical protein
MSPETAIFCPSHGTLIVKLAALDETLAANTASVRAVALPVVTVFTKL